MEKLPSKEISAAVLRFSEDYPTNLRTYKSYMLDNYMDALKKSAEKLLIDIASNDYKSSLDLSAKLE